jgi:hypothetical protein
VKNTEKYVPRATKITKFYGLAEQMICRIIEVRKQPMSLFLIKKVSFEANFIKSIDHAILVEAFRKPDITSSSAAIK